MIGYIFSLNPIGAFLFSFILGNKMQLWGRKRCMVIGLVIIFNIISSYNLLLLFALDFWTFLQISM